MANKTEIQALSAAEKTAQEHGVYIVGVTFKKTEDGYSLCYYIDKDGGVGIDECEEFSRAVEIVLDELDFIETNYTLEVSSPGADRQLTTEREFLYYIGRDVDVKLYKAENGKKEFSAVLTGFNDGVVTLETDGSEMKLPVKQAAYIKLSFSF